MKWEYLWLTKNYGYLSGSAVNLDEIKFEIEKEWKSAIIKRESPYLLEIDLNEHLLSDILGGKEWELISTYVEKSTIVRHVFKRPTKHG